MEQVQEIEKIRNGYTIKRPSKLEELKALDRKVKRSANIFAYAFGTVGALVFGSGMTLAMGAIEAIGTRMVAGVAVGVVGIAMAATNYFIHRSILRSRKKKYAQEIIKRSDELLNV